MEHLIYLITNYKYLILFPLAIMEGPVLAVISGFLCTNGFLNPLFVYPLLVFGDITGDSVYYAFGRWGMPFLGKHFVKNANRKMDKIKPIRSYVQSNPGKIIPLSKITIGLGLAGILLVGNSRLPYRKFIILCLITSALQYLIYLGIGILFGAAYIKICEYFNFFAAITAVIILVISLLLFVRSVHKKIRPDNCK